MSEVTETVLCLSHLHESKTKNSNFTIRAKISHQITKLEQTPLNHWTHLFGQQDMIHHPILYC